MTWLAAGLISGGIILVSLVFIVIFWKIKLLSKTITGALCLGVACVCLACFFLAASNEKSMVGVVSFGFTFITLAFIDIILLLIKSERVGVVEAGLLATLSLLSILVAIMLIALLEDSMIQNIVTAIVAAVFGGMITLVGVAWTIKWSNQQSNLAHMNAIKPFFYATPFVRGSNYKSEERVTNHHKVFGDKDDEEQTCLSLGIFENSDKIEFLLKYIKIDSNKYYCSFDNAVTKGQLFTIRVYLKDDSFKPNSYILFIENVDGQELMVNITLEWDFEPRVKTIKYIQK